MPQSFWERIGIQLPQGEDLTRAHSRMAESARLPDWMKDIGRGALEGIEGIAMRPQGQDPNWKEMIGGAVGTFGLGPMRGVTRFIQGVPDAAGVMRRTPDVAARVARTNAAREELIRATQHATPVERETILRIADRYPRTLAHTDSIVNENLPGAAGMFRFNKNYKSGDMILNPDRRTSSRAELDDVLNVMSSKDAGQWFGTTKKQPVATTFAHELQHVGQRIQKPSRGELSQLVKSFPYRSNKNPVEQPAREGSFLRVYGIGKKKKKRN